MYGMHRTIESFELTAQPWTELMIYVLSKQSTTWLCCVEAFNHHLASQGSLCCAFPCAIAFTCLGTQRFRDTPATLLPRHLIASSIPAGRVTTGLQPASIEALPEQKGQKQARRCLPM